MYTKPTSNLQRCASLWFPSASLYVFEGKSMGEARDQEEPYRTELPFRTNSVPMVHSRGARGREGLQTLRQACPSPREGTKRL